MVLKRQASSGSGLPRGHSRSRHRSCAAPAKKSEASEAQCNANLTPRAVMADQKQMTKWLRSLKEQEEKEMKLMML
jgi:hypothetical protein